MRVDGRAEHSSPAAHSNRAVSTPVVLRLQQIAVLGLAGGVWSTWPLWTGAQSFPQIPWLGWVTRIPLVVDWLLLAACGFAAIILLVAPQRIRTITRVTFAAAAIALVLLDQHRLQVWALHLLSVLCILWLAPNERGVALVRLLAISVYVHSAVSRCDRASLELQWNLVAPLLERSGRAIQFVSDRVRLGSAALFAVAEMAVAVLLAVPRWRSCGRWASIAMHGLLWLLLGPLGLDHHGGVLVWNAAWIAQNWVLFGPTIPRNRETAIVAVGGSRLRSRLAAGIAGVLIAAPLLEPWGLWDHWPSWRLYSARPATVVLYIDEARVADLPATVQAFVGPPEPFSKWRPLSLDAWSFSELDCPVYPQERFRRAVALSITREFQLGNAVKVVIGSPPDRWTGTRQYHELHGVSAMAADCEHYLINVAPRAAFPERAQPGDR